jgi:hypothetical protein
MDVSTNLLVYGPATQVEILIKDKDGGVLGEVTMRSDELAPSALIRLPDFDNPAEANQNHKERVGNG